MIPKTPAGRARRPRRLLAALTALAAGISASPASAQNSPRAYATAQADHMLVTPGGVDVRSGRYDYRQTDLAIGGEGEAGLQLTRLPRGGVWGHVEPFANFTHNLDIMIAEKKVHIGGGNYDHGQGNDYRIHVRFGGRSETFDAYGTAGTFFTQISKAATARLTYGGDPAGSGAVYTFQAADGTLALFRPIGSGDCSSQLRCAYVSSVEFPDGTRLSFDYDALGGVNSTRLRRVASSRGYALLLEYAGLSVVKACLVNLARRPAPADNLCPADAEATSHYAYVDLSERLLASATDAAGGLWTFQHGLGQTYRTIGFVKPGQTIPWLTNSYSLETDQDGTRELVVRQDFANGQWHGIDYHGSGDKTEFTIHQIAGATITDGEGHVIEVEYGFPRLPESLSPGYDPNRPRNFPGGVTRDPAVTSVYQITPGPIRVIDPIERTTTYEYCDEIVAPQLPPTDVDRCVVTPLRHYTDPEGIRTVLSYDAWRNVTGIRRKSKPGEPPLDDILTLAAYDCLQPKSCAKPRSLTDANGNTTDFTYSPDHGGVLTETGPAVNPGTGSGAGAVRPQTRHEYVQRRAWLSDGAGGWQPSPTPVWLRGATSFCRASAATGNPAAPCALAGDEVRTVYDYGPDAGPSNLLPRGQVVTADGTSLRTCFAYDSLGRKVGETRPNAQLGACP